MAVRPDYVRPLDLRRGRIDMNHGAGGRASMQLVDEVFARAFDNEFLRQGNDGALLPPPPELLDGGRLVMACDGHVVSPLFFAGGDLGCLAVHGTVNDVAMLGARPLWLSASFILEEGLPLADLKRLVDSMAAAARAAGVAVVTGDTKVVEQGKGDRCFICTTGVGVVARGVAIGGAHARPGDVLLLSGPIGDHGVAVLATRESLALQTEVRSDTAALHGLVAAMLAAAPAGGVHVLRDPTRGGLGTTLNEIARQSGVGMLIDEAAIPVQPQVQAACELLGLDVLYIANEGKLVAAVAPEAADAVLAAMRAHPLGAEAVRIGSVVADAQRFVQMHTRFGGRRIVDWLSGEPLPRIC
jgi:hydrogenase expression/formation protein HypE